MKFFLLLFVFAITFSKIFGGEPHYLIRVFGDEKAQQELDSYDILSNQKGQVELIVSKEDFQELKGKYKLEIVQETSPLSVQPPSGYRNLEGINKFLHDTEKQFPQIAKVIDIAKEYGPGKTHEGRPIYALKLSNNARVDQDKPNVLILSAHHCREIVTPEIALKLIEKFTKEFNRDSLITKFINTYQIFIVPILNVDGLDYVWKVNRMWRKNRKPFPNRVFGVDLNRNYDLDWVKCGGSSQPSSDVYKGPSAFSEEETQTVRGLSRRYQFAKVIDFHSYGREVLHAYHPCTRMDPKIRNYIIDRSRNLAETAQYRLRDPSGNGQHQSWQMKENTFYSFLVETHTTFQPPYQSALQEIERVYPIITRFLNQTITLQGHVKDESNLPLRAEIVLDQVTWYANETKFSNVKFGYYHMFLPVGQHKITFKANGYKSETINLNVENLNQGFIKNIQLKK